MMAIDYELLGTLHRMLRQQTDLTEQIEKGPRMVRVAENAEKSFEEALEEAKQKVIQTKMAADDKQLQLAEREAKIEDLKNRLNACDSNKEYQLLKDAIAADTQANSVLSDEILELLERIDVLESEHVEATKSLDKAKTETQALKKRVDDDHDRLKKDLDDVIAERTEKEKLLKGDVKKEYTRLVNGLGEDALAKSEGKTCGNCCHTFTQQTYNQFMKREPIYCRGCGALMYMNLSVKSGLES